LPKHPAVPGTLHAWSPPHTAPTQNSAGNHPEPVWMTSFTPLGSGSCTSPGSPAADAGLKAGDVVRSLDGKPIDSSSDLSSRVAAKGPGARVGLDVVRDGADKTIDVKLGTFPEEESGEDQAAEAHKTLGMTLRTLTPDVAQGLDIPSDAHGVVIVRVEPGSLADTAGLRERDVVVSVDGQPVADVGAFHAIVEKARPADVLRLRVRRGAGYFFIALRLS